MSTHGVKYVLHTRGSSWNPNSNTPESDRSQQDRPTACVIAQQYSSTSFESLRSHSLKEKVRRAFQKMLSFTIFLISFKLHVSSCVAQGVPAYLFVLHFCNFVTGSVQTKETHMSDITSKFHIIATPVTVDIQALTHTHSLSYTHIHSV